MLASIMLSLVLSQTADQTPLFPKLFPNPTGANGYEEFVRAQDMMQRLQIGVYMSWQPPENRPKPEPETKEQKEARELEEEDLGKPDPKVEALRTRLNQMSRIQVRAEEVQVGAPIIALIRKGLEKPIMKPGKPDPFGFPGLAAQRQVSGLLSDAAYVEFARGRPSAGYELLKDGLRFGDALSPFGTLDLLTGVGIAVRTLAGFDQHLERIPLAELQQLPATCQALLQRNRLAECYAKEQAASMTNLDEITKDLFTSPPDADQVEDPTIKALVRQIRTLTPAQKKDFNVGLKQRLRDRFTLLLQSLKQPESQWIPDAEPTPEAEPKIDSLAAVRDLLVQWTLPPHRNITVAYVRHRTQLRLLDIHSRIQAFRWINGRLPAALTELGLAKESWFDPLSRSDFVYEVQGPRTYRLYSKGIKETGEVELRYVRPKGTPETDTP